jgi:hydrogenase maturation protease
MNTIGIIGLGNPLRRDDGIGLVLLDQMQCYTKEFGKNITFIDGGTGGMNLLHQLSRFGSILIIDAVDFKGKPGDAKLFSLEQIKSNKTPELFSTHESDFITILALSAQLNELPENVSLFGVQPFDVSFGTGLSKQIVPLLDDLSKKLKKEIQKLIKDNLTS